MTKSPSAKNTASSTQPSASIHPFKRARVARQLLAMLGDAETVTLFHRNDEGKREGIVTKPIADFAAAIHEARHLAGDHHVFAEITGIRFAYRYEADARKDSADLLPSYAINGPNGIIHLVYLTTTDDNPLRGIQPAFDDGYMDEHDDPDAYAEFDVPLLYGDYQLHHMSEAILEAGEPFEIYTVKEVLNAFILGDGGDDDPSGLSADAIPSIDSEPTETRYDVEFYGEWNPVTRNVEVSICKPRPKKWNGKMTASIQSKDWIPWSPGVKKPKTIEVLSNEWFDAYRVGDDKDDGAFFPGELSGAQKLVPNVKSLYMAWVDVDNGALYEETKRLAFKTGLFFILHASHNFGSTQVPIHHQKYGDWCTKKGGKAKGYDPNEPTVEAFKEYLREKSLYLPRVIDGITSVILDQIDGGWYVLAETIPIEKHRIGFVLDKPVLRKNYLGRDKELIAEWGEKLRGLGLLVGVNVDESTLELNRGFYRPSARENATPPKIVINRAGASVKWEELERARKKASDPFEATAEAMGGSESIITPGGVNLKRWADRNGEDRADYFDIVKAFNKSPIRDEVLFKDEGNEHLTVQCPLGRHLPSKGKEFDPGCFVASMGNYRSEMHFQCSHETCKPLGGKDRLKMLCEAIKLGWIDESTLYDPEYDLMSDREATGDGQVGLDALIEKARTEKDASGAPSITTMEALMNCLARQKSRVPIYERIKGLKIVGGLTDFKKEVEARAKNNAREAEAKKRLKDGEGMPGEDRHYPLLIDGIRAMNEVLALVQRGSGVVFYQKRETDEPWLSVEAADIVFRPWTYGKEFEKLFPEWLDSTYRDHRTEIVFKPYVHGTKDLTPKNHLNLYRGLALEPVEGDCMDYYRHVFHIICGGNMRFFKYVITWLAQMMQQPDKKPGTALVLRGLKGIGKGIFVDALRPILGRHSVKVSDPKQLTGNFNGHMDAKILAIAEEAFFGGDRKVDSIVKDMITSDRMMLERKFMDATEIDDYRRFIFLSNAENVVRATPDERRYAVTLVPPEQMHNRAYWDHFVARIADGELPAELAYDLLHIDLDRLDVDLRTPPRTAALMDQILTNQSAEDQWLRGVLTSGTFLDADGVSLITEPKKLEGWRTAPLTIAKDTIYESYRAEVGTYYGKEVSAEKIGKYLLGMFKETEDGDSLVGIEGNGVTGRTYILPSLPDLRAFYEDHHLPLNHRTVDNEADFIRLVKPQVAMYPKKPETQNKDAMGAYRIECAAFEMERVEVRAEADEFIRKTLGLNSGSAR
ncbi:DUF5906 domain-containing protein [Mesorhizobium sp. M1169]|uniref:primase-helicase family protein n=1 Tax=Mesorhizobium sp. M1169 TaxID=2957066 RepID=UPI00333BA7FA